MIISISCWLEKWTPILRHNARLCSQLSHLSSTNLSSDEVICPLPSCNKQYQSQHVWVFFVRQHGRLTVWSGSSRFERLSGCLVWPQDRLEWFSDRLVLPVNRLEWPSDHLKWPSDRLMWPLHRLEWLSDRLKWPSGHLMEPANCLEWPSEFGVAVWPFCVAGHC